MTKKTLNQNGKYVEELKNAIEPDFNFNNKPINRFKKTNLKKDNIYKEKSDIEYF